MFSSHSSSYSCPFFPVLLIKETEFSLLCAIASIFIDMCMNLFVYSLFCWSMLPGASMGDLTHDKGHEEEAWQAEASQDSRDSLTPPMTRSWGRGLMGKADQDSTGPLDLLDHLPLRPKSVCYTIINRGCPWPPFSEENYLRARVISLLGVIGVFPFKSLW